MEKKFKIGEKIVYGSVGVAEIVDLRTECVTGTPREYYVLCDLSAHGDSHIFVPADNPELVASMRPIMTEAEARVILEEWEKVSLLEWEPDSRVRMRIFREITESGDIRRIISMIKAIRNNGKLRLAEGKKNFLSDENAMRKAERLVYTELSAVLGIPVESISDSIAVE